MEIEILLNELYLSLGILKYVAWNPQKAPHIIVVGNTGSGKTYFTRLLLGKIALYVKDSQIFVADFKGDNDFSFLDPYKRFYRFSNCGAGLREYYEEFEARQSGECSNRNMLVLLFDEWASYINFLEKKEADTAKRLMTNLLQLGRSFNVHVIISQQRADASYFNSARDNLNIAIGLGNLSEESKAMLFYEFKSDMKADRRQGTGYMVVNGADFIAIQVPVIQDMRRLESVICKAVER